MQDIKVIISLNTVRKSLKKTICKMYNLEIYKEQYRVQCNFLVKVVRKEKMERP